MTGAVLILTASLIGSLLAFLVWSRARHARLLATVQVQQLVEVPTTRLGDARTVTVFLPPGYDAAAGNPPVRYPILYVNDGQDVAALRLRETMARLLAAGQVAPFIAVAVPTGDNRLQEYGTAVAPNAQGLGSQAADYSHFVTAELMPLINAQFRTRIGPAHTAFLGASLGGLSAFDIVWHHPGLFGLVGVFSGSFWWRAGPEAVTVPPGRRIAHAVVRRGPPRPDLRAWFEAGTRDETADRDQNGVIDAIQDTLELMAAMAAAGAPPAGHLVYHEVPGGRHDYETWAAVLPAFLKWAFPGEASPG